ALPVQVGADRLRAAHDAQLEPVVGGRGLGSAGVGYAIACGSWTMPSVTVATFPVNAVTEPFLQLPTPVRGVDSVPLICVCPPDRDRLPLEPTLPPEVCVTGWPFCIVMLEES